MAGSAPSDPETASADDGRSNLAPTAARLVEAARRVLAREGFGGLTVEAVAAESGEYRDSIRYYFGSKAGLVAAVVDSLTHDQSLEAMRKTREVAPGESRIGALLEGDRHMAEDSGSYRDFFEILPHALKDDELRGRVAELYDWYRDLYVRGLDDGSAGPVRDELRKYAALMTAMIDGLALQKALDPGETDLDVLFALWDKMLRATLGRLLGRET
jgi:TetR/AcrR family transcriptional repressor of bet genes